MATTHHDFAVLHFQRYGRIGQLGNIIRERRRWQRDRAVFGDGSGNGATDGGVEVGGGDFEPVVLGFEQDVRENRQRIARRNRAASHAQSLGQIRSFAGNFHGNLGAKTPQGG